MRDVAIDLGSANTLVSLRGRIVLNEPSVVAIDERTGDIRAIGRDAWQEAGSGSSSVAVLRPLRHGAVMDFEVTERFVKAVFQRIGLGRLSHPRALAAVSSAATAVERRAVEEAILSAGARSVSLIDEAMAAAIGSDMPIDQPTGSCIIDIGGGTTEVAVVSMGGVVASRSMRVGGFDIDDAITRFLRDEYGMAVGDRTAEAIKVEIGSAFPTADEPKAEILGRELATGLPKSVTVGAAEVRGAIDDQLVQILEALRQTLAETPPELAHDVLEKGMVLTGGGGLLRGLAERINAETDVEIHLAEAPLESVVRGVARGLETFERLKEQGILA